MPGPFVVGRLPGQEQPGDQEWYPYPYQRRNDSLEQHPDSLVAVAVAPRTQRAAAISRAEEKRPKPDEVAEYLSRIA